MIAPTVWAIALLAAQAPAGDNGTGRAMYIDTASSPARGSSKAPLTIVEFTDYHCRFCGAFFRESQPKLDTSYIQPGRVRYVIRDYPILSRHRAAMSAAIAAHCAGEQGRFWDMHHALFTTQRAANRDSLAAHARTAGLDQRRFSRCLESDRYTAHILRGLRDGRKVGIRGTPTFFLAVGEPGGSRVRVLRVIHGAIPYEEFKGILDETLRTVETAATTP